MEHAHPTFAWQPMQSGNAFYKRQNLYLMQWNVTDLADYIVAAARFGGPIALMRDQSKVVAVGLAGPSMAKTEIRVYSSAGEGLLLFAYDQGKVVKFGWTSDERLVVLNEEGNYRLYDLHGDYVQFSLGRDANEVGVVDARIYDDGLVALTASMTLLEVKGWDDPRPLALANTGLTEPPSSWAVIPPDVGISRHAEVLLASGPTVLAVDTLEVRDQKVARGPFSFIAPSPNGRWLALFSSDTGALWVVSSDFSRTLADYDTHTHSSDAPAQVEWCGNDAIMVAWPTMALLVGPFGDTLVYGYSGSMVAVNEIDGIRVIASDTCDLIQKVPNFSFDIFRPGSSSPSAILYDAWENFTKRSPKADEGIRAIRPDLASAVDACIAAAAHEWDPFWQRKLLNAAKFGRTYLDLYNPTDFVNTGQTLRLLNALREFEIGIPLTHAQFVHAGPARIIDRLTVRGFHRLALRVSDFLHLSPAPVLRHWAFCKISASNSGGAAAPGEDVDDAVCKAIVKKFEDVGVGAGVISYADVAKKAWEVGKPQLATKLLDHEALPADQVPLLLNMKEDRLALKKAVDSGDTNLIYYVLLHIYKRLPLGAFFRLIEDGGPELLPAARLLEVYAREQNRDLLRDFYFSEDRRLESAVLALDDARRMTDPNSRVTSIKSAKKFFSEDKDRGFEAKMMDENARLLQLQQQLEHETDNRISFVGQSLAETITTCIVNSMLKKADQVRSDFKMSDKRFWHLKLRALIKTRDFTALEAFSRSKRSPIGYEAFVRALLENGHKKEGSTYVARCDGPRRAELYVECGDWAAAGKVLKERGEKAKLENLRKRCTDSLASRELDVILSTMK